ncbi:MAG: trypsin-like peptidase domain-containing protein [Planctomycetota bacterium]|nr:trypsin-like peptidase domain-containing protein [Planctomycetota bacterium]
MEAIVSRAGRMRNGYHDGHGPGAWVAPPVPAALLAAVLAAAGAAGCWSGRVVAGETGGGGREAAGLPSRTLEDAVLRAKEKTYPALVHILPVYESYGTGIRRREAATGSGFVFTREGDVLTNYHVAGKARSLTCTLSDGRKVGAKLIGGDPWTDIAVIRLNADDLRGAMPPPAALGNSDSVRVGQFVLAMGSPLSLSRSVSLGIVSCVDRYMGADAELPTGEMTGAFNSWIQTDAAINLGNSGGPLVNLDGEVIGVNARAILFGGSIGFAIPINVARSVAESILRHGRVIRSDLGIAMQHTGDLPEGRGSGGVLVASVIEGGPADEAGVRPGDRLLGITGPVGEIRLEARFEEQLPAARRAVAELPVGATVTLLIARQPEEGGGEPKILRLKATTVELGRTVGREFEAAALGLTARGITRERARRIRLLSSGGVEILGVASGGPAEAAGLAPGQAIVAIDRKPITSLDDLKAADAAILAGKPAMVLVTTEQGQVLRFSIVRPRY